MLVRTRLMGNGSLLLAILLSLSLLPCAALAHSGKMALATPLDEIVIDGDLSDWPQNQRLYKIRDNTNVYGKTDLSGVDLDTSRDLSPEFMVGYSVEKQRIYVAIRVIDDVIAAVDGCEIYLGVHGGDEMHQVIVSASESESGITFERPQFLTLPDSTPRDSLRLRQHHFEQSGWEQMVAVQGEMVVYEWAITPMVAGPDGAIEELLLEPGMSLAFDITVQDRDHTEDVTAWIAWSPEPYKYRSFNRVGDLWLTEPGADFSTISGTVRLEQTDISAVGYQVAYRDSTGRLLSTAITDADGIYRLNVFSSSGYVSINDSLQLSSNAETQPVYVTLSEGQDIVVDLEAALHRNFVDTLATSQSDGELKLSRFGRYRAGDNIDWAKLGFNDANWRKEMVYARARVWWTRRWLYVDEMRPLALIHPQGYFADSLTVFLNGNRIGDSKVVEDHTDFDIPIILALSRGENLLAIRYAMKDVEDLTPQRRGIGFFESADISLVEANDGIKLLGEDLFEQSLNVGKRYMWIGIPLSVGLTHLLLFAFFRDRRENLYYGISAACLGVCILYGGAPLEFFRTAVADRVVTVYDGLIPRIDVEGYTILGLVAGSVAILCFLRFMIALFNEKQGMTLFPVYAVGISISSGKTISALGQYRLEETAEHLIGLLFLHAFLWGLAIWKWIKEQPSSRRWGVMIFWGCCMLGQMISTLGISMSATGLCTIRNDFLANSSFIIKLGIVENGSVYLKEGVLNTVVGCANYFSGFFSVSMSMLVRLMTLFATLAFFILLPLGGILRRVRGARIVGFGVLCTLFAYLQTLFYETWQFTLTFTLLDVTWQPLSPTYAPFILLAAISIHLARQFGDTNRDLAERIVQVEALSKVNLEQERSIRTRMENELEEARQLQLSLLPDTPPATADFEVGWFMKTATEVGGDYYDYQLADDGSLTLILGDATGHGMQAGTLVTATKSLFQSLTRDEALSDTVRTISSSLQSMRLNRLGMALTLVQLDGYKMRYCPAGIPPILIYRAREHRIEEGQTGGLPAGLTQRGRYWDNEVTLEAGDAVLLMSDGLPERTNDTGEELGYQRVQDLFLSVARETPSEICKRMAAGGDEWAKGRRQDDDVSFVVIRIRNT